LRDPIVEADDVDIVAEQLESITATTAKTDIMITFFILPSSFLINRQRIIGQNFNDVKKRAVNKIQGRRPSG